MIPSILNCMRFGTMLVFLAASAATAAPSAEAVPDLQTLLQNTVVEPPARVNFREERHNEILREPLVLTGYLEYLRRNSLRKVVESPFEESFLIEAGQVTIEREGKSRTLPLGRSKSLRTLLTAIEAILAGDVAAILSSFDCELAGSEKSWSVLLTPTSSRIRQHIDIIQVNGNDRYVGSIRVDMQNGEWSLIQILHDDPEQ